MFSSSHPGQGFFRISVGAVLTFAAFSTFAQEPSRQELLDKIDKLQARVEKLEAERNAPQVPTQFNPADVDRTVDSLLKDANRRSTLADLSGFLGGWDEGFKIRSADGNFLLHPWLQLQFRGVANYRQHGAGSANDDDSQSGFEIRRMYFVFDGHLFSPDLKYFFLWAMNRHTGSPDLLDAWVQYHLPGTRFTIKAGQIQNPLDHESLVFSRFQLAAERSLVTDVLAGGDDYVQGVQLGYDNDNGLRAYFAVTDGFNNNNKNFQDYPVNKANFGLAGRAEYKLFGDWKDYGDFTALSTTKDMLIIGAAFDWTQAGDRNALRHVFDISYETAWGLSLFAAYLGRYTTGAATDGGDTYDPSVRFQAAYAMDKHWELFARYDWMHLDAKGLPPSAPGIDGNVHEITAGLNYYFYSHRAKLTIDLLYLPSGTPVSDDGSGVLPTGAPVSGSTFTKGGGSEVIGRVQFQLWI